MSWYYDVPIGKMKKKKRGTAPQFYFFLIFFMTLEREAIVAEIESSAQIISAVECRLNSFYCISYTKDY